MTVEFTMLPVDAKVVVISLCAHCLGGIHWKPGNVPR